MPQVKEALEQKEEEIADVIDINDNSNKSTRRSQYTNIDKIRNNPVFAQLEDQLRKYLPQVAAVGETLVEEWNGEGDFNKLDIPLKPVKKVVVDILQKVHSHPAAQYIKKK